MLLCLYVTHPSIMTLSEYHVQYVTLLTTIDSSATSATLLTSLHSSSSHFSVKVRLTACIITACILYEIYYDLFY